MESSNPAEETYCIVCGSALDGIAAQESLAPLPVGAVLADAYVIEANEECTFENRYRAVRTDNAGARVVLRERSIEEGGILSAVAEQTASLTHPALVLPERFFVQGDRAYLAGPDIAGTRLSVRVGLTSEREAISWGINCVKLWQPCTVMACCVELPPEGVLLDKEGRIRLTHCESLSRKAEALTLGAITDGYAAPEVYKASEVGEQADVFAIGALLFSLVVGKRLPVEGWIVHPDPPIFYPEKVVSPHFERVLRKAGGRPSDALRALTCSKPRS
jgi:hypothetical protein